MNCDIILDILGTKEYTEEDIKNLKIPFFIGKGESSQELSSIQDIAEFIAQSWDPQKGTRLLKSLYRSPKKISASAIYQNKQFIGNATLSYLKHIYSDIEEWDDISEDTPYNITLVDKAFVSGKPLKGRVIGNGVVTHIIRDKKDAENFIRTELIKQEAGKVIDGNNIKDDYLKEKYSDILTAIKNKHSKKIKQHIQEVNPEFDGEVTISHLIEDFLNYKKDYQKLMSYSEDKGPKQHIDAMSKLSDFCRELRKQQVFNEDSETPIARRLRAIRYNREKIGKKDMYETILNLGDEKQKQKIQEIGLQNFINLDTDEMQDLLSELFMEDPIMSRYKVTQVEETKEEIIVLSESQVNKLIKARNKELGKGNEVKKEALNTVAGVEEFFGGVVKFTNKEGQTYDIKVIEDGKELVYQYRAKKLHNNSYIRLKKFGRTLRDEFDFGYDTMQLIQPVNRDGVKDGSYKSYYIFEYKSPKSKNSIFLVSRSVLHPDLYDVPKFGSLKDAKLAIQGFIRSANIAVHSDIAIKKAINSDDPKSRSVLLKHPVVQGQAISSIYFPINKETKLNPQEQKLFNNGNISDIQNFYKKYGISLETLDTAEKIGIFLYAMAQNEMTIENLSNWAIEEKTLESDAVHSQIMYARSVANSIIERINNAPVKHYLIEKWDDKGNGNYLVYLKALNNAKINSSGVIPNRQGGFITPDTLVRSRDLYYIKSALQNTLFSDSNIKIEVKRKEEIAQLQTEELDNEGNQTTNMVPLFPDTSILDRVKAFVHGNSIYIVKENANVNDLIHETFHILFGSIKASNPEIYKELITHFYISAPGGYKTFVNKYYPNLVEIDRMEEVVVRSLSNTITNKSEFFNTKNISEIDKMVFKSFIELDDKIKTIIKKANNDNDINFPTTIRTLIKDDATLTKMQKNRLIANVIQKGIENGQILRSSEDC